MEDGFVKAFSDNLPYVDFEMVCSFMNTQDTIQTEIKHGKTKRWVKYTFKKYFCSYNM